MTPSAKYNTEPVPEAYVAVGHTDLRKDIEKLPGFIPYVKYSNNGQQMLPGELGSVGVVRFVLTNSSSSVLVRLQMEQSSRIRIYWRLKPVAMCPVIQANHLVVRLVL